MLLVVAYTDKEKGRFVRLLIPWFIGTIYAATDEIHQLFVPGRSGQISDVCLDSIGVLIGVSLLWVITEIKWKKEKRSL